MMKFLGKGLISKVIASTFLILLLESLFSTTIVWALTSGPHQQEYKAYEEPGATDMVNLLTGDFSFRLPAINVPGPEGGFSLPLSYNAGIGPGQESSWVGLGWTLNAGAIARNIVEFPDDAQGESFQISRADDDIARGFKANIPIIGQIGWDTNVGHYGRISILGLIGASYKNGNITGGNVIGMDFSKDHFHVDPVGLAMSIATIVSLGTAAAGSAATASASATASGASAATAASAASSAAVVSIAKQVAVSAAIETASTLAMGVNAPKFNVGSYWKLSQRKQKRWFYTNYWVWLDQTRYEDMYGVLNLDKMPVTSVSKSYLGVSFDESTRATTYLDEVDEYNDTGAASDMYYHFDGTNYGASHGPSSLALDNYSVMGPGISGLIHPYRLDVGCLSMPRDMSDRHVRMAPFKFSNYKVQFKYEGDNTNGYIKQVGKTGQTGAVTDVDSPYFGVYYNLDQSSACWNGSSVEYANDIDFRFSDPQLMKPREPFEDNRYGLTDKKLSLGKNIEWYTNQELITGVPGFMDYLSAAQRLATVDGKSIGAQTIGGYKITREDGKTYYYTLPIYEWDHYTKIWDKDETDKITEILRPDLFPSTWLLTGITGPDFVDRGTIGKFDDQDWGYWVSFDYGKFSSLYNWRIPYHNSILTSDGTSLTYTSGNKQQYYLDKIITRTHTALFIKDLKKDTRSASATPASALKLSEVVVLKNSDLSQINIVKSSGGSSAGYYLSSGDNFSNVIDVSDINSTQRTILNADAIKRVKFTYDYSLCPGAINSFDVTSPGTKSGTATIGKLTLKSISLYGANNAKTVPDFQFGYASNPVYDQDKWDGWGFYNTTGTADNPSSHVASSNDSDGYAWSLNQITTPLGSVVDIGYERDTYSSISGYVLPTANKKGGDIRVSSIQVSDDTGEQYKTHYIYTTSGVASGTSSGVVAQEPDYIKTDATDYDFYNFFDYPNTPVMYGTVTILNGKLTTDSDFYSKVQYQFVTPDHNMIDDSESEIKDYDTFVDEIQEKDDEFGNHDGCQSYMNEIELINNIVDVKTSPIGSLNSVKTYDQNDDLLSTTQFNYTDRLSEDQQEYKNMGIYTEGTFMFERLGYVHSGNATYKAAKTTKRYFPYFLESITSTNQDGFTTSSENLKWDFITGKVIKKKNTDALGLSTLTETIPAYKAYPEMGPIPEGTNNSHMLAQDAAVYSYKLNSSDNPVGLVGASVQTWSNDWNNYRELDANGIYQDVNDGYPRWRKKSGYIWEGDAADLNEDGTLAFNNADRFNFNTSIVNTGWRYGGEINRYDSYSMPVESKDMNDIYACTKTDISSKEKVLDASNAKYTEVAFSSVENGAQNSNGVFDTDGEVRLGGTIVSNRSHTGENALEVSGVGETAFQYKMSSDEYNPDGNYRMSVWVESAPENVELYYKLGNTVTVLSSSVRQSGNGWYRLEALIPGSSLDGVSNLEVGCRTLTSTNSYLDDFRFQPIDASMAGYVYDKFGRLTFVLDNENMFTEYQYNDRGQLTKTYGETFSNGKVLLSEIVQHYKLDN